MELRALNSRLAEIMLDIFCFDYHDSVNPIFAHIKVIWFVYFGRVWRLFCWKLFLWSTSGRKVGSRTNPWKCRAVRTRLKDLSVGKLSTWLNFVIVRYEFPVASLVPWIFVFCSLVRGLFAAIKYDVPGFQSLYSGCLLPISFFF